MKKDLIGVGSIMLIWFVVLVILGSVVEPYIVAFWSLLAFSLILLILGVLRRGSS